MNGLKSLGVGIALGLTALFGTLTPSEASTLQGPMQTGLPDQVTTVDEDASAVVKVGHKQRAGKKRAGKKRRKFNKRSYRRHHRKFHKRYNPRQRRYKKGHRRFHRHYKRRHSGPKIYLDINPGYYDPFYYTPRYYDPYYDGPPYRTRLSCDRARRIVRRHGYRRVRTNDCRGKVYGFTGYFQGRRYKIRVSAYSGAILSRRRY